MDVPVAGVVDPRFAPVREAFVRSVRCSRPPVIFQTSQLSMVPAASSPASARRRASGAWSSSHASFVALK